MTSHQNFTLKRTDSNNGDFLSLIKELDAGLWETYGDEMNFYGQYNKVDLIKHVVVAYINNTPAGCGAFKAYDADTVEIKRMFVKTEYRNKGIAGGILDNLESWAKEAGYSSSILETGDEQHEAIGLYKKKGYTIIENYGQYAGAASSVCFRKQL